MHSPTLIALAAILAALVTAVLHLVWRFNKHIPGLGFWVLSFLSASVFGANLLVREHMPLVLFCGGGPGRHCSGGVLLLSGRPRLPGAAACHTMDMQRQRLLRWWHWRCISPWLIPIR